jgi:hypothetical protein
VSVMLKAPTSIALSDCVMYFNTQISVSINKKNTCSAWAGIVYFVLRVSTGTIECVGHIRECCSLFCDRKNNTGIFFYEYYLTSQKNILMIHTLKYWVPVKFCN